eukprot:TRINITY_DN3348_c0_g1_i1.p1 TRINITY_DN3348_c0_g1~~TRINITY_DN3348_c0_g1_i1.p1  ORF type:complete len:236 (+),score=64.93 TRINITY_DN3348_c0_g1_i1:24-710(+)
MSTEVATPTRGKYDLKIFDASKPKRRRRRAAAVVAAAAAVDSSIATPTTENLEANSWLAEDKETNTERDYHYPELLKRIYDIVQGVEGERGSNQERRTIDPPEVGLDGTRKTVWKNFGVNCRAINRELQHVLDFVLTELGTTGDLGENGKLTLRGRFQAKQFENLLKKYISEYVTCRTCKSPDTDLKKENRLVFKVCHTCGSSSSVASIQAGFRSVTRAARRAERNKV